MAKKFAVPDRDPLDVQLETVGRIRRAAQAYRAQNVEIFQGAETLAADLAQAEASLKDLARRTGQREIIGHGLRLEIQYRKSVTYDARTLLVHMPDAQTRFSEVFNLSLDAKAFERRIAMGEIPDTIAAAVRVEIAGTPAVSIKDA